MKENKMSTNSVDPTQQGRLISQTRQGIRELRESIEKTRQAIHAQRTSSMIFYDLAKQGRESIYYLSWKRDNP